MRLDVSCPLFPQLFPEPTGRNGYEEYLRAADAVRGVPCDLERVPAHAKGLASLQVTKALALVREGNEKPATDPRPHYDPEQLYPELATFKFFGKLLAAGSLDDQVQAWCLGSNLPRTSTIGFLVGAAIRRLAKGSLDGQAVFPRPDLVHAACERLLVQGGAADAWARESAGILDWAYRQRVTAPEDVADLSDGALDDFRSLSDAFGASLRRGDADPPPFRDPLPERLALCFHRAPDLFRACREDTDRIRALRDKAANLL